MERCCCGFGHRDVFESIDEKLYQEIINAINYGCSTFYVGSNGDFDKKFEVAVRKAKHLYSNIKLVLVLTRMKNDLNKNKEFYCDLYDDIIIPTELADVHYKQIITKRNQWIIDRCDVVIGFVKRDYGGAYQSLKYAQKKEKIIKRIEL